MRNLSKRAGIGQGQLRNSHDDGKRVGRRLHRSIVWSAAKTVGMLAAAALFTSHSAHATTLYWDANGADGFGSVNGAWDGLNAFWNQDSSGAAVGPLTATTTDSDDLTLSGGTAGTIDISGTQLASSFIFSNNVANTLSGGTLQLGGFGARQGIYVESNVTNATTINSAINLVNSAATIQNDGSGLLTLTGVVTTSINPLTVNGSGNVAINGAIVTGGGNLTKMGSGTLILGGANTYTGNTILDGGTIRYTVDNLAVKTLQFGAAIGNGTPSTVDLSTTPSNLTVTSINVITNNTGGSPNLITVGAGKTLSSGGLTMGYDSAGGTGVHDSNLTISGAGAFSLTGTTINVGVNQAATNAAYFAGATLDLSDLTGGFTANVTTFNIGVGGNSQGPGTVKLSNTANTLIATTLTVADTGSNNGKGTGRLTLGTGTNVIQADTINIGRGKETGPGVVSFASQTAGSSGTVTIRNKAGTGAANITVGNINAVATAGGAIGTLDLRGHVANVNAGTLLMGQTNSASNVGAATGTVSFDAGTFTVATLNMAPKTANSTGTAAATLNVGGGTFTVNTAFTLGSQAGLGASVATLNITGGTFVANTNILKGAGATTATINLNGASAVLDMKSKTIGNATLVNALNLTAGTLQNLAQFNNGLTPVTVAGTVTLAGTNAYTGGTTLTSGTLLIGAGSSLGSTSGTLTVNAGTLNINGNDLGVGSLTGTGGTIVNNLAATNKVLTIGNGNATGGNFAGVIANNSGTGGTIGVTKVGTGSNILSGINTYTGPTIVNAGSLIVTGSIANTSAVTVAAGGTLNMVGGPASTPASLSSLNLGAGTGAAVVGLGLGANAGTSASLNIAGAATTANTINFAIAGLTGFGSSATYDLINAGSGLNTANYGLAFAPGGFTYSVSKTNTKVQLAITGTSTAGALYWRGQAGTSWSAFSVNDTNWFTDAAGTANAHFNPGANNSVVFSATNATGPAIATTLDNNFSITNLQFAGSPAGVSSISIAPGTLPTNSLTITPAAPTGGIGLVAGVGAVSISAPVVLGASQTWSVDSSTPGAGTASSLTVSGPISGASGSSLTFTNTGGTTPIILAAPGTSTYAGPSTLSAGTIVQGGAINAFSPNTAWTINGTLNTGPFSQATGSLIGGTGIVQNSGATAATLSIGSDNAASATFGGTIQNGSTGALALTKAGTGEQIISGINTYTGATTVTAGVLRISSPITSATTFVSGGTLRLGANNVLPVTTAMTLSGTGTLDLFGNSQTIASLANTATNTITNSSPSVGASTATTPGSPALTDALSITAAQLTGSLPVLITDGPTRKTQIILTNANLGAVFSLTNTGNTFSGGLVLAHSAAGTRLDVSADTVTQALGTGPIIVGQSPADKAGIFFPGALSLSNPIIFNTALGTDRVGLRADGPVILTGKITANLAPATFTSNNSVSSVEITNQVTGANGLVVDIVTSAAAATAFNVTLNNATANLNDYQGNTVVNFNAASGKSATLTLGAANQIPNGLGKGDVAVNTSANGTGVGTLNLNGFSETINGLNGSGVVDGAVANTPTNTLTLGDANANGAFSGSIRNSAGTLSLVKIGSGTQTLTGTSTFSGSVTVNAGTLALGGNSNFAGNLTVSNGATAALSGTHTFTGSINADTGGIVTFASSPATDGPLGNSTQINLNSGTLSYTASGSNALNRPVAIAAANPGTINVASSTGTLTIDTVTSAGGNLIKSGPGVLSLTGSTTLNGGTAGVVVNGGTLKGGFGTGGIGSINVGAQGNLSFQNSLAEVLTLGGPKTVTLASGAKLGFELGAPGTSDRVIYNTASVAGGSNITLNFFNLGGLAAGSYTLLSSATVGGLTGVNFSLGLAPNGFNYTINNNGTNVTLTTANYTPIFWRGGQNASWNTLGAATANWSTNQLGTVDSNHKPLAAETVIFGSDATAGPSITTTLDAAFTVDSVQFTAAPAGVTDVTINPGAGGTLTVTPASSSGGLRILSSGGNATINAPVTVGASQTWDVADATSTMALTSSVAFNAAVNKTGPGIVTLSGPGTGAGSFTLAGGTLNINSATALGGGALNINAGTTIDSSAAAVVMSTNNAVNVSGDFTFAGTNNLKFGTGAVTLANNPTITTTANTLTFGGAVSGSTGLTKAGAGTLALGGANSYNGATTVNEGALNLLGNNTTAGQVILNAGTLNLGHTGALGAGGLVINGGTIDNVSGAALTNANNNAITISGSFAFAGTNNLNLGTGAVAMTATPTITTTAGTLTIGGNITGAAFGMTKTGPGTLVLSGANVYNGTTNLAGGTLNLPGTITTANGNLNTGTVVDSATVVNLSGTGGYLTSGGNINLGTTSLATGAHVVNVTPGTNLSTTDAGGAGGTLNIATVAGGSGVINQTGGTVTVDSFFLGGAASGPNASYGFYNQTGGTFIDNNGATTARFRIAAANSNTVGLYYLSGGTSTLGVLAGSAGSTNMDLASAGTASTTGGNPIGVIYITGTGQMANLNPTGNINIGSTINTTTGSTATGQLTIGGAGSTAAGMTVSTVATSTGTAGAGNFGNSTINLLSGGTLTTGNITKAANGSSNVNFNGGTLKASATGSLAAAIGTYSYTGGATIDTNGFNYTIAAPILAPAASGIGSIAISDPGAGYAGAPAVLISGGSGTGATAIAQVSGGVLTGIVITNPGTGYDPGDSLTVTLTGGGATTPATPGTVNFAANVSGGLTKNNAGSLILSGANTYTGPTTINAGTLQLGAAGTTGSLSPSSVLTFGANTVLAFNRTNAVVQGTDFSPLPLTGNMSVIQAGTSTTTLNANNTYSGPTTISAGTLIVGDGGTNGTIGAGPIALTGSLQISRNDTYTFAPTNLVTGTGSVILTDGIVKGVVDNQFVTTGPLIFGAPVPAAGVGTPVATLDLTNGGTVAAGAQFGSINVRTNNNLDNTITVAPTKTLTINGGVTVGYNIAALPVTSSRLTVGGGGSMLVQSQTAGVTFQVGGQTGATGASNAAVDLSGLSSFTLNYNPTNSNLRVSSVAGASTNVNGAGASLKLAPISSITVNTLGVGESSQFNGIAVDIPTLTLGATSNIINASTINIGTGGRDVGQIVWPVGSTGTITIRDAAGTGGAALNMGTGGSTTGVVGGNSLDLRGHLADVQFAAVNLGTQARSNNVFTNTLSFDTGTLSMASLTMATTTQTGESGNGANTPRMTTSTLNIGGGTTSITGGILQLGQITGTSYTVAADSHTMNGVVNMSGGSLNIGATGGVAVRMATINVTGATNVAPLGANGVINFTGGTTTVAGDIISGGIAGTSTGAVTTSSTVTINGGSLDMLGNKLGTAAGPITTVNFQAGGLANVGDINNGASLDKTTAGTLIVSGTNAYPGATNVTAGVLRSNGSIAASSGVTVSPAAKFVTGSTQTVKSLAIADGASAELASATLSVLTVGNNVNTTPFSMAGATSSLDMHKNVLIVDYPTGSSPIAAVKASILTAYSGGTWTGVNGIRSTEVTASTSTAPLLAIGYAEATSLIGGAGTINFGGLTPTSATVDATSLIVRTTLSGDADLDGTVNLNDLIRLANNYGTAAGLNWSDGDFDYSGGVDLNDLIRLANNYGSIFAAGEVIPGAGDSFNADLAAAFNGTAQPVGVPEPTTLGLAAVGAAGVLMRRRRRA